jgi:gamma-glutamylcyclotransferase (GGCT)/AIG2-like uncharacterized protein YtfP
MTAPEPRLYFLYGECIDPQQVHARCVAPRLVGRARLENYALAFFGYTMKWDGGGESLLSSAGATVWGALYDLSADDAERLDAAQGVRLDGTGAYFHYPVDVVTPDGASHEALTYLRGTHGEAQPPSREYLEHLAGGARELGIPAAYIDGLLAMASKPASFPVPKKSTLRELVVLDSCHC